MNKLNFLVVDKLNANDDSYKVLLLNKINGDRVFINEVVATVETSKATIDIVSPFEGYINSIQIGIDDFVEPGQKIAIISEDKNQVIDKFDFSENLENNPDYKLKKFTKKALELIYKLNLDINLFDKNDHVTSEDINSYLLMLKADKFDPKEELINIGPDDILLIGGQGTANMLIDLIVSQGRYRIAGIVDPNLLPGTVIDGVKVLGGDELLSNLAASKTINIALSFTALNNLKAREEKYHEFKRLGFCFPVLIHPDASVEKSAFLGEGTIVLAGAIVGSKAQISEINFVNTGSVISHEVVAGLNNHFAPNSTIAGKVIIGKNNLFGMNSSIFMGLTIGNMNIINNGVPLYNSIENFKKIHFDFEVKEINIIKK